MSLWQGGMFTGTVDKDTPKLTMPPGLTAVKILDYDETMFINFEVRRTVHFLRGRIASSDGLPGHHS